MCLGLRKRTRRVPRQGLWSARCVLVTALLLTGVGALSPSGAAATPFQRGDVFAAASSAVQEYSPTGALVQTIPGSAGARSLCFDPSGKRLILPGVGLFDRSGSLLQSNWATVQGARCVADGLGHVYVSADQNQSSGAWTITQYSITGKLLRTFSTAAIGGEPLVIDLAPDQCTIYYGNFVGAFGMTGELNACTNTLQPSVFGSPPTDDLRVLPNWQVLMTDDPNAALIDTSGSTVQKYYPSGSPTGRNGLTLRSVSLDPDGTSFWLCCTFPSFSTPLVSQIFRFDIGSGQLLASWPLAALTPINVYAPPLVGDADIERTVDANPAGTAEAFSARAGYTGHMSRLRIWVAASSTATNVLMGIYSNRNGRPGTLLSQATISNPRAGSWNYADATEVPLTAGQRYWIAVLTPHGAGTIRFRDTGSGGDLSQNSSQHNLTTLPPTWSPGASWNSAPASAYGS